MKKTQTFINKGFTLIELLVVMAIIGILAAMLITGVVNAIERGNQVHCASNLRDLGAAVLSYKSMYQGRFPGQSYKAGTSSAHILQYLYDGGSDTKTTGLLVDPRTLSCRSAPQIVDDLTAIGDTGSYVQRNLEAHSLRRGVKNPAVEPVFADLGDNHNGSGVNVVFLSGTVEFISSLQIDGDLMASPDRFKVNDVELQLGASSGSGSSGGQTP